MKKYFTLFLIILFFASCKKEHIEGYKTEKNTPSSVTTNYVPMVNLWDTQNNNNIFILGYFNSSLEPTRISHILLEDNEKNTVYATEFVNGSPKHTYTVSTSNKLGKIFIEYSKEENLSFIMNIYECDWDTKVAVVLKTAIVKKNGDDFTFELLNKNTQKTNNLKNSEESDESSIGYVEVIEDCTDDIIVEGIEWIVDNGYLDQIIENSSAKIQLSKLEEITSLLRKEQANFGDVKSGNLSSLDKLYLELNINNLSFDFEIASYNYSLTIEDYVYSALKHGTNIWVSENLKTNIDKDGVVIESFFYDNNSAYEEVYARLYDWEIAQNICPDGWHIPSTEEWDLLLAYYGGRDFAAPRLLTSGDSQIGVTYAGFKTAGGSYVGLSTYAGFWTSDEFSSEKAYINSISLGEDAVTESYVKKTAAYSVRCVRDY